MSSATTPFALRLLGQPSLTSSVPSGWYAAAVIANFEMMTRLADGTGARLTPERIDAAASIRQTLGLDAFPSARPW